jgi:pimeloyl-ACP methyl ester carboxylesterase
VPALPQGGKIKLMQVIVDKLLTHYREAGKGKTILLLHGWGDSAATFDELIKALAGEYRLLAPDLPGFGATQPPPQTWGLNEYAAFVGDWLKKIGAPELYAIIGHSNGGAVAMTGLADNDLRAKKLVLLASSGIRGESAAGKRLKTSLVKTGKLLSAPLPAAAKKKLKRRVYEASGSEALLFPHLEDSFKKIVAQDIREDAAKLDIPTLLIYGTADDVTPVRHGEMIAGSLKDSRLETITSAGHFVHCDAKEPVELLIRKFLG